MKSLFWNNLIALGFCIGSIVQAQQLSSVLQSRNVAIQEARLLLHHKNENSKCLFGLISELQSASRQGNAKAASLLKILDERPALQTSIVSPEGHFRIHFDTIGENTPALLDLKNRRIPNTAFAYVDSVATIFDYVWDVETIIYRYPQQPFDGTLGGDDRYDIYIEKINSYGETTPDDLPIVDSPTNPLYTSWILIDADFSEGVNTYGLAGLKVTAAHEFFHAIQVGNYGYWPSQNWQNIFYYEMSSVWMEDEVYPSVNDYYYYLQAVFQHTDVPLNETDYDVEYGRAIFNKFLSLKFSKNIVKEIWENIKNYSPLVAIQTTLQNHGVSLEQEFPEYALWHFYTGIRADSVNYFPDAKAYPTLKAGVNDTLNFLPPMMERDFSLRQLAFIPIVVVNKDTGMVIVANINYTAAVNRLQDQLPFTFDVRTTNYDKSYCAFPNGWRFKCIVPDPNDWKVIGLMTSSGDLPFDPPYPNPVVSDGTKKMFFPLSNNQGPVELEIYSTNFLKVHKGIHSVLSPYGRPVVQWDLKDDKSNIVSSGVYIYILKTPSGEQKGKIAIIRK